MEDEKKELKKDDNYVLENMTLELEMIKDDTISSPENTLKEEEFRVKSIKKEEVVDTPKKEKKRNINPAFESNNDQEKLEEDKPKKKNKAPIIIFILLLLICVGAFIFIFTQGDKKEKEEKDKPKADTTEISVSDATDIVRFFEYDDKVFKDDGIECNGRLAKFFKDKTFEVKDIDEDLANSYIVKKAYEEELVESAGNDDDITNFEINLDAYKNYSKTLFGDSYEEKIKNKITYSNIECLLDEGESKYACEVKYTVQVVSCTDGNVSYKVEKATYKDNEVNVYVKVLFKKDDKFYSDYAKEKVLKSDIIDDAFEELQKGNYIMKFKKNNNDYTFISSSLVK